MIEVYLSGKDKIIAESVSVRNGEIFARMGNGNECFIPDSIIEGIERKIS